MYRYRRTGALFGAYNPLRVIENEGACIHDAPSPWIYQCYVWLPLVTEYLRLFIDAPVLSFGAYNPLRVIENEAVTLTCHIDAFPPVTNSNIRWEKNGVFQGKKL